MTTALALWLGLTAVAGGVLGSMLGLGGGIIIVPVFTLLLGLPIHVAIGASLVAVVANASAASSVYLSSRLTNMRLAFVLATVTAAGALIGGLVGTSLAGFWLTGIFGVVLAFFGVLMFLRPEASAKAPPALGPESSADLDGEYFDPAASARITYRPTALHAGLPLSFVAGNVAGLLGLGGGIIQVPLMNLLMGVPMKAAAATSSHIISLTATAGAIVYFARGFVDPVVTAVTVIGVYLGARTGARLAQVLPGAIVKRIFAVVLLYMAIRMLATALNLPPA